MCTFFGHTRLDFLWFKLLTRWLLDQRKNWVWFWLNKESEREKCDRHFWDFCLITNFVELKKCQEKHAYNGFSSLIQFFLTRPNKTALRPLVYFGIIGLKDFLTKLDILRDVPNYTNNFMKLNLKNWETRWKCHKTPKYEISTCVNNLDDLQK